MDTNIKESSMPQKALRHRFKTTIKIALPDVKISEDAPLKEWASIARNEDKWDDVIDSFFDNVRKMRENEILDEKMCYSAYYVHRIAHIMLVGSLLYIL